MRKIFLSTILTLCASEVYAITMEEALVSGYTHNEDLKSIRNSFLNEIEEFPKALTEFMPRVSINLNSSNFRTKKKNNGFRRASQDAVSADGSRYTRSVILDQPVFDGWSSVAAIKSAQYAFKASRSLYYSKEQETFLKEINAYLNCFESEEKYKISKISVRANVTLLESASEKFKLGEATETEVASAREQLATAKAAEALAYSNYEAAKANFYQVFGVEPGDIEMPKLLENLPENLILLTERALAVNPTIDNAVNKSKSLKAAEMATKGKLLPNASFRLESTNTYHNAQQAGTSRTNNLNTTSTFSVNVPILARGGAEYSDIRRAKYRTKEAFIAHDSAIKTIKSQCNSRWAAFSASKERVEATDEAVRSAEIAYEGMTQEELFGSKTIIDVLGAEVRLNKARENSIESKKELILAAYQIKSLIGELTAKSLNLKVDYFEPEKEFKKAKLKIVGF